MWAPLILHNFILHFYSTQSKSGNFKNAFPTSKTRGITRAQAVHVLFFFFFFFQRSGAWLCVGASGKNRMHQIATTLKISFSPLFKGYIPLRHPCVRHPNKYWSSVSPLFLKIWIHPWKQQNLKLLFTQIYSVGKYLD